jgi:hypothetical protein
MYNQDAITNPLRPSIDIGAGWGIGVCYILRKMRPAETPGFTNQKNQALHNKQHIGDNETKQLFCGCLLPSRV